MNQGNRQGDDREGQAGTRDGGTARKAGPQAQAFDGHLGFRRGTAAAREWDRERSGTQLCSTGIRTRRSRRHTDIRRRRYSHRCIPVAVRKSCSFEVLLVVLVPSHVNNCLHIC
jgi:hypothetical protein